MNFRSKIHLWFRVTRPETTEATPPDKVIWVVLITGELPSKGVLTPSAHTAGVVPPPRSSSHPPYFAEPVLIAVEIGRKSRERPPRVNPRDPPTRPPRCRGRPRSHEIKTRHRLFETDISQVGGIAGIKSSMRHLQGSPRQAEVTGQDQGMRRRQEHRDDQ